MSKIIKMVVFVILFLESIFLWFFIESELINYIVMAQLVLLFVASLVALLRDGAYSYFWRIMATSSLIIFLLTVLVVNFVHHKVDNIVGDFLKSNGCRTDIDLLSEADRRWNHETPHLLVMRVEYYGAVREMRYFDNGLLRYGFMHDEKRSIHLPACAAE